MGELYLVTGAAGHLGSTVVDRLLKLGKRVRILVLPGERNLPEGEMEVCYGDVCKQESLIDFFSNPQQEQLIVIHCAGIVSIASKYQQIVYDVNVTGTKNITNLCLEYQVKKLIYVSSVHAIPEKAKGEVISEVDHFDPQAVVGLYARTKSEASAYVLQAAEKGLNLSIVHPSGICGPFDHGKGHLTTLVIDYFSGHLPVGVIGGYDFVDVRDVANGIVACCEKGKPGECYILSNRYYSVREILGMLYQLTGIKEIKVYLPIRLILPIASLTEAYAKMRQHTPLFTAYSLYTLNSNAIFSHAKATAELSYTAREMRESLNDTIDWLKLKQRIKTKV